MQQLRRLSGRRAARLDAGAFVVEGPTLLAEALAAGAEVREVFVVDDADSALLQQATAVGAAVHRITPEALAGAVDTVTPQGIAAIVGGLDPGVDAVLSAAARGPLALVLVGISDPGNAGTLVRVAEAAGAAAVLFCEGSVDPWSPKCVRASAGALFHVPVTSEGDIVPVLQRLREAGVRSVATVVRGGVPYHDADLRGPVALLLGNEAHGLPAAVTAVVDVPVSIPMAGRAESLNVAMAGSILCFEALRQGRTPPR